MSVRARIEKLERQIRAGEARLDLPGGGTAAIPGGGDVLLKLLTHEMRVAHAEIEGSAPPAPPTPKYEESLALLREATNIHEPGGPGIGRELLGFAQRNNRKGRKQ